MVNDIYNINIRIRELRKALKMTQAQFAEQAGIVQGTVSELENMKYLPGDPIVYAICYRFPVNCNWLKTGEGEMFEKVDGVSEDQAAYNDPQRIKDLIAKLREIYFEGSDTERIMMFGAIENMHDRMTQRKKKEAENESLT